MRNFIGVLLSTVLLVNCTSIDDEFSVASKLSKDFVEVESDGMVIEAEKNLGKLYKEVRTWVDSSTGSSITMLYAARDKRLLDEYFATYDITFSSFDSLKREDLKNKHGEAQKIKYADGANNNNNNNDMIDPNGVFYDDISIDMKEGEVGYTFSVMPKSEVISGVNSKARSTGVAWRQQTSLPWCEVANIRTWQLQPYSPDVTVIIYWGYRGLFWSGGPTFYGTFSSSYEGYNTVYIDGSKYTRFGLDDDDAYLMNYFGVEWIDYDTGNRVRQNMSLVEI